MGFFGVRREFRGVGERGFGVVDGDGVQYETNNANDVTGRYFPSNDFRTVFAGVAGGGLTIDVGHSGFIRPQVRTYLAPGANRTIDVTALPSLGLGWRF